MEVSSLSVGGASQNISTALPVHGFQLMNPTDFDAPLYFVHSAN